MKRLTKGISYPLNAINRPVSRTAFVRFLRAVAVLTLIAGAAPAFPQGHASFNAFATSPTTIPVGGSVSFSVIASFSGYSYTAEMGGDPPPDYGFSGPWFGNLPGTLTYTEEGGVSSLYAQSARLGASEPGDSWYWDGGTTDFSFRFPLQGTYNVMVAGEYMVRTVRTMDQYWVELHCDSAPSCYVVNGPYFAGSTEYGTGSYAFDDPVHIEVNVVPEPKIYVMMSLGLGLMWVSWRSGGSRKKPLDSNKA